MIFSWLIRISEPRRASNRARRSVHTLPACEKRRSKAAVLPRLPKAADAVSLNPDAWTSSYHPYCATLPRQLLQHTYSVLAIPRDAQAKTRVLPMHHNFVLLVVTVHRLIGSPVFVAWGSMRPRHLAEPIHPPLHSQLQVPEAPYSDKKLSSQSCCINTD